jgi:hypothetical protein
MLIGGFRQPPCKEQSQFLPVRLALSAAANKCMTPQASNTMSKARHHWQVSRNRMIPVVAGDHTASPFAGIGDRIVHSLAQRQLDRQQSRSHSLGHGSPLHLKLTILASSTDVRQSQKIKRLGRSLPTIFPILFGKPSELDQPRFLRMQFQSCRSRSANAARKRSASFRY